LFLHTLAEFQTRVRGLNRRVLPSSAAVPEADLSWFMVALVLPRLGSSASGSRRARVVPEDNLFDHALDERRPEFENKASSSYGSPEAKGERDANFGRLTGRSHSPLFLGQSLQQRQTAGWP